MLESLISVVPDVPIPDPTGIDFREIAPGVPTWVPLAAQLIPWIAALLTHPDASNRQRFIVNACMSALLGFGSAFQAGGDFNDALAASIAAVLSAQVGYGLAKGYSNGAINEINRRRTTLPATDVQAIPPKPRRERSMEHMATVTGERRAVPSQRPDLAPVPTPGAAPPQVLASPPPQQSYPPTAMQPAVQLNPAPAGEWFEERPQGHVEQPEEAWDPPPQYTETRAISFDEPELRPIVRERFDGNADRAAQHDQPEEDGGDRYL